MCRPRILIVEDDPKLGNLLADYLRTQSYDVMLETRGDHVVERIAEFEPALLILDVMLPGCDGFEVCRRVSGRFRGRILMLTARRAEVDQIVGLELGADDYVKKPVPTRVLLARVRALLRREPPTAGAEGAVRISVGSLLVDRFARTASVDRTPIELTSGEFDLLWCLASGAGRVIHRSDLYRELGIAAYDGEDRALDLRVSRLRRKLVGAGLAKDFIKSVRGEGYQMVRR